MKHIKTFKSFLTESVSQEAYMIHSITQCGQDAAQNFIDDNNIDAKKLADYVKQYIKTYESFLFENTSVKSSPIIKELNRILELNKKRGADKFDVYKIPNNWIVYDKVTTASKQDMMEPSQCFQNALDYSKESGAKCVVGGFIDKNELINQAKWVDKDEINMFRTGYVFYPHAFNLTDKGEVYDITIYNDPNRWVYVGIEIDPNKFDRGFSELLPYLNKLIGRKI